MEISISNKTEEDKTELLKKILNSIDNLKNHRGNLCLCKCKVESKVKDELSFVEDEVLCILEMDNEEIWFAINTEGEKGFIPSKSVLLLTHIMNEGGGLEEIIEYYIKHKQICQQNYNYLLG